MARGAVALKLAIFDEHRLGVVTADGSGVVDVTEALPFGHDPDPVSDWWRRLCRDMEAVAPRLRAAAAGGPARSLAEVRLRAPVLNPSKVVAAAINYPEHVVEMRDVVLPRAAAGSPEWLLSFDVFLKAPSSIVGPTDAIVLPEPLVHRSVEVHHESELAVIVGRGGSAVPEAAALDHVLGYTIGLDITERGLGDRSRRKSWDTFTPLGPWITTADEVPDPQDLTIRLQVGGEVRQHASTRDMHVGVAALIAHASRIMRLEPGDVILTGAPPGVGEIHEGDLLETSIHGLGRMRIAVVRAQIQGD